MCLWSKRNPRYDELAATPQGKLDAASITQQLLRASALRRARCSSGRELSLPLAVYLAADEGFDGGVGIGVGVLLGG